MGIYICPFNIRQKVTKFAYIFITEISSEGEICIGFGKI